MTRECLKVFNWASADVCNEWVIEFTQSSSKTQLWRGFREIYVGYSTFWVKACEFAKRYACFISMRGTLYLFLMMDIEVTYKNQFVLRNLLPSEILWIMDWAVSVRILWDLTQKYAIEFTMKFELRFEIDDCVSNAII